MARHRAATGFGYSRARHRASTPVEQRIEKAVAATVTTLAAAMLVMAILGGDPARPDRPDPVRS